MEEHNFKRKLATIMVADIVGFSRLAANDEDWTIRALGEFRKIVDGIIGRHDGRIFNTGGDSVLAEFASPVEAVRCAVDFQEAARSRNLLQPRDKQLRFRIGINLGDVMVSGTDLLGDGVNVAARLESIAEPGGICVSGTVWDQVNGKLSIGYVDIGEQSVKNIPRPVRAYHLRVDDVIEEVRKAASAPPPDPAAVPMWTKRGGRGLIVAAISGVGVIIILSGGFAWQFWLRGSAPVSGSTATPMLLSSPTQVPQLVVSRSQTAPQPSMVPGRETPSPLHEVLSARLASALPRLMETAREDRVRKYEIAVGHKALAVSLEASSPWRSTQGRSAEEAETTALEQCQVFFGHPCALLAVDDAIQRIPADQKWIPRDMPRARYSGEFDPEQVPGLTWATRQRPDLLGYCAAATPKAAAVYPWGGRVFSTTGAVNQHAAEETALKTCNYEANEFKSPNKCFLYAVGDQIVLTRRVIEPLTAASGL